jgi:hypothetical protein
LPLAVTVWVRVPRVTVAVRPLSVRDELALLRVTTATAATPTTATPSTLLSSTRRRFTGQRRELTSARGSRQL